MQTIEKACNITRCFVLFFRRWRIAGVERENIFRLFWHLKKKTNKKIDRELFLHNQNARKTKKIK